ncbi:type II and III secretion system protein family protein [Novosphingobium album (ex Hu et al. 2023)]|uniref:Type II and III secretion system protein family protein n=1 Tax=Novosphingobium album (ex Hu et al. 2023) TaxID=2930093 RepID=A0ABT0B0Z5_9SPHN|nr:type II and III secretion system protein family protein [Novosphingobium album (ex Hu et al. 2023)]MCJ2178712.1 type II and III secretion system protein family protein [Novosphingobium album (ex Hu et al. 2023)]
MNQPMKRLALLALSCAMAAGLTVAGPMAAHAAGYDGSSLRAGTLQVPLNKSQVVSADRPIAKAMIGSDEIADILPVTDRSIYVLGKKMGTTSLTLYDSAGRVLSVLDIAVGPDVEALESQLHDLIPNEQISARISNDSIVLTGVVNDSGAVDRAVQIARTYAGDKVVNLMSVGSSQQVMLEVRFAEVNRTAGREIGVNGFGVSRNGSFSGITGRGSAYVPGTPGTITDNFDAAGNLLSRTVDGGTEAYLGSTGITGMFGILRKSFSIGNVSIDAMLNALEERGLSKTLAQPTLIALSGDKASFLAGGEFPVPVAQSSGGGGVGSGNGTAITVEFKPFGVSLGFTPTVLGDKTINLIVEPEVSEIDPSASLTLNGITIPGLRTRRASTTLELRDGESFAIAGLLQKDFKTNIQQMPLLGSIPILGALFRSTQFQKGETELLIVVTPHLVAPLQAGQVQLPTDRIKDPNEASTFLMGQPYDPVELPPVAPVAPAAPAAGSDTGDKAAPAAKGDGYEY